MIFLSLIGAHKLCIVDVYLIETCKMPVLTRHQGGQVDWQENMRPQERVTNRSPLACPL